MSASNVQVQESPMIVWTAVPKSRAGSVYTFSVYATIRLGRADQATVPLSSYVGSSTLGVTDWPALVRWLAATNALGVKFNASSAATGWIPVTPKVVSLASAPDSATWRALFNPATTMVNCFTYTQASALQLLPTYDPGTVIAGAKQPIQQTIQMHIGGVRPEAPRLDPARATAIRAATKVALTLGLDHHEVPAEADDELRALWETVTSDRVALEVFKAARRHHLADIGRRHVPGQIRLKDTSVIPNPVPPVTVGPSNPQPDFHATIAKLGDFPVVLRKLGIVFDLSFDTGLTLAAGTAVWASVQPNVAGTDVASWAQASVTVGGITAGTSLAFPTGTGIYQGGMLDLTDATKYTTDSLDADSAAQKLVQGAAASDATTPSLRSGGLTVYHGGKQNDFTSAMAQADILNAKIMNPPATGAPIGGLLASVARGYRIDAKVDGKWYSLCQRHVDMTIGSIALSFDDEGYVKQTALSSTTYAPSSFVLQAAVFGWDGWSLVAPRPHSDGTPTPTSTTPTTWGYAITTNVRATPGSLPPLRFGKSYSFRARMVDVTGNSLGYLDPSDTAGANEYGYPSAPTEFVRHEPVAAPALLLRAPVTEGESVERLVIRSDPYAGLNAGSLASELNAAPDKVATYGATSERHVAPPHASLPMSELHGALDPIVQTMGAQGYANCAQKAAGSFDAAASFLALTGAAAPTYATSCTPPFALATSSYLYHPTPSPTVPLTVPYLPDPNAATFALNDYLPIATLIHPHPARTMGLGTTLRGWTGTWPDVSTFLVQLAGGAAGSAPSVAVGTGSTPTVVSLPPGMMISCFYSAGLAAPDTTHVTTGAATMAYYQENATLSWMPTESVNGQVPVLTPSRTITFVHAVPRPAVGPNATSAGGITLSPRAIGDTFVMLAGHVGVTAYDTGAVAVEAAWQDPTAPATGTQPLYVGHQGHVFTQPVDYADHLVSLPVSTTLVTTAKVSPAIIPVPPPSATPTPPRHELGDTKARTVTYTPVGHTRYKEYFPASFTAVDANVTTVGQPATVLVPSTARPADLRILEIVPTFRWDVVTSGRRRVGGGLRVYVDGDWFSSGDGERLAVVLRGDPTLTFSAYQGKVSGWSADPVWGQGSAPVSALDSAHFNPTPGPNGPLFSSVETGVAMQDLPASASPLALTLVTYAPQFNPDRGLWFFDIEMSPDGCFMPFVRLALARYQKASCDPSIAMSKIVMADVTQLLPHRTGTIVKNTDGTYMVDINGMAGQNDQPPQPPPPPPGGGGTPFLKVPHQTGIVIPRPPPSPFPGFTRLYMYERTAEAEVQTSATGGDFGWTTLGTVQQLQAYTAAGDVSGTVHFLGKLTLASAPTAGTQVRVVLREWEQYATDPTANGAVSGVQARLFYTDTLALPS